MSEERLSRNGFIKVISLVGAIPLVSACDKIINPASTQNIPESTSIPSQTGTLEPSRASSSTPTETPTPTPTETPTPTREIIDWNYVSNHTDEEIFQRIGIPDSEEYRLSIELTPHKILRNEGGQSIALFQNPEGIVFLAQNLETGIIEHAVYAEYEEGVPLLLLTDQSVIEHDNGWYQLNAEYGLTEARNRLAHAFNRALSIRWWSNNHPGAGNDLPYGVKDWLDEIPGYGPMEFLSLTRSQRREISDYIMQRFLEAVQDARTNNIPLSIELADRHRTEFNAATETLIIKTLLADFRSFASIFEHHMDSSHREVVSERSGSMLTLLFSQPSFLPYREPRYLGGTITHFFRYFFGPGFYQKIDTNTTREQHDMTGPILEDLCAPGSLPSEIVNLYSSVYPAMNNYIDWQTPTNTCSVIFGR